MEAKSGVARKGLLVEEGGGLWWQMIGRAEGVTERRWGRRAETCVIST
jgi:hypothetical protein